MKRAILFGAAMLCAAAMFATVPSPARAATTLKKIGNAIQYPVRKAGQNISITTHRIVGNNSVQHTNHGHNVVITPGGHKYMMRHHRYAHRRSSNRDYTSNGRKYYYYDGHRYWQDMKTGQRHRVD